MTQNLPRYARLGKLIRKCFNSVCDERDWSKTRLYVEYAQQLNVSIELVKAWRQGIARPRADNQIELIAREGFFVGQLSEAWVSEFLSRCDCSTQLASNILREVSLGKAAMLPKAELDIYKSPFLLPFDLPFANNNQAKAITIYHPTHVINAAKAIGLSMNTRVLLLVGGANGIDISQEKVLRPLFNEIIAPLCEEYGVTVIDGGTDAGVMRLMGEARTNAAATFPLVGVAATGTIRLPMLNPLLSISPHASPLQPDHSHFVFVPGPNWSEESPWFLYLAQALSSANSALTLLVNGGEISWSDIWYSMVAGQPVIAVDGSGRTADIFSAALRFSSSHPRAEMLVKAGIARCINLNQPEEIREKLTYFFVTGRWPDEKDFH